tara:strand:+ start:674 stop:1654 length:981 start_codon:yes stop_codon:yes gene_type:complete
MKNIIKLIVDDDSKGQRVDQFIKKKVQDISRNRVKNLIIKNKLKINEIIVIDPSKKIRFGDKIYLEIPNPEKIFLKPYDYRLNILYNDSHLMVVDKDAGISMHPGAGNYDKTLVNALINYDKNNLSNIGDELRPGIVHRIDKDTSGLVVIAKNNISHENLSKQFKLHSITRIYQALIWGKLKPQSGKIETLITRSSKNRQLMEIGIKKGKKAITNYKTIEVFENKNTPTLSLIECRLETGRTHQIRVHMSYKGNNILGDKKYKKKFKNIKNIEPDLKNTIIKLNRQFLHAKVIGFTHPISGKKLEFSSKLPEDLDFLLKKLRNTIK